MIFKGDKILKKIGLITLSFAILLSPTFIFATGNENTELEYTLIPELNEDQISLVNRWIKFIGEKGGDVWERCNAAAEELTFSERITLGCLTRDDPLTYCVFLVSFLSDIGLVIGAIFIMYAGYTYMLSVFNGGNVKSKVIKNAIIGVIIVIFSYAILKFFTAIFLGS